MFVRRGRGSFPQVSSRAVFRSAGVPGLLLFLAVAASFVPAASAQDSEAAPKGPAFDPAQGAGLFLGVNDPSRGIWFAADDAADLAYLFAGELGLIAPERTTLALSEEPTKPLSRRKLRTLRNRGARVVQAKDGAARALAEEAASKAGPNGLLVWSFFGPGYQAGDYAFVAARPGRVQRDGVSLLWLAESLAQESAAKRRLVFADAAGRRRSSEEGLGDPASKNGPRRPLAKHFLDSALAPALGAAQGQAVFLACSPGRESWEAQGNGLFAASMLEAFRGGAAFDAQGFLSAGAVAERAKETLAQWSASHEEEPPGFEARFQGAGEALPLVEREFGAEEMFDLGRAARQEKDFPAAFEWFEKASRRGHLGSLVERGAMLDAGEGLEAPDPAGAFALWRQAADMNHPEAMRRLGLLYREGRGVEPDEGRAVFWFSKAAFEGDPEAMRLTGLAYRDGTGLLPNPEQAQEWLLAAERAGDPQTPALLEELKSLASRKAPGDMEKAMVKKAPAALVREVEGE